MTDINRRLFMLSAVSFLLMANVPVAMARDSESGNSGSGGGSDGGGSDGGDDGGADDHGGGDDGHDNDDDGDDNVDSSRDHDRARNEVNNGNAVSLRRLKSHLAANYPGKIVQIRLRERRNALEYRVRILQAGNKLKSVTLNAKTLQRTSN